MLHFVNINKWESHRDSKGRVPARQRTLGRLFLINTNRVSDLISTGGSSCKFYFQEDMNSRREAKDYIEALCSVADMRTGRDTVLISNLMTLPVFEKNNPNRPTVNTTIAVEDFIYADANNADPSTSWVVYMKEGFKRARSEALVDLSVTGIGALVIPGLRDYDGNLYTTVTIGSQEWIVEDLQVTHYSDGTAIPNITGNAAWQADVTGAWCYYLNNSSYNTNYGKLYNWYAVDNASGLAYFTLGGVQQVGWRVPTRADIIALRNTISGDATTAGGFLKEIGTTHWDAPNTGATDTYGFRARAGGNRYIDNPAGDGFDSLGAYGDFWNSEAVDATDAYSYYMDSDSTWLTEEFTPRKLCGLYVRCVRDV